MKAQTPSNILARNGFVAGGKKVEVKYDEATNAALGTVLEGLEFFMKNRQPRDKIVLQCRSTSTERGIISVCIVSLAGNSDNF